MVCSQLLLTGFLIYWLCGQYREERISLQDQLGHEYYMVHDRMVDSMLMMNLVFPSLDDSLTIDVFIPEKEIHQSLADSSGTVVMMKQFVSMDSDTAVHKTLTDSGGTVVMMKHLNSGDLVENKDRIVRSVKLFIDENVDAFKSDSHPHLLAMSLDSAALLSMMEKVLELKGWNFSLEWTGEDPENVQAAKIPGIVLEGNAGSCLPLIHVRHISGFLILTMLPQILFGLVLLILSASALLFASWNLKKQITLHRLRDDFIGNISHELKTPVSTVKIALEALRKYDFRKDPKASDEYLEMASGELERLEKLVGKVLHHDMLRNPSLVLNRDTHDLCGLVRNVLRTLEVPIREAGAKVELIPKRGECPTYLDPVYGESVIMNLIDNSLKYGGPEPVIEIQIESNKSGSTLTIRDHGPGIPEEYRNQVFEKFFRIPQGNRHDVKGYGLGLNFASQVMKQHTGSISYTAPQEGGIIFTLHFPIQKE